MSAATPSHKITRGPSVSLRASTTPPSPIRKFLPLVWDAEKKGVEVIKLNVGDPDLTPPSDFLKEIHKYKGPQIPYAPSPGIRAHVDGWITYYKTLGINLEPKNLIPTVGCAEAIMYALMATTDPGDDVLIFEPFYPSYKSFSTMLGIKLNPVTLSFDDNYALVKATEIEKKIGKRTKALVIVNPGNPTGIVFTKAELKVLVAIAKKHNLFIISDETYRDIIFEGTPSTVLDFKDVRDRAIVVDSASKRFSMPGARIGCLVSYNEDVMKAVLHFAMARLSAGTLEQLALIPLLKKSKPYIKKIQIEYKKRSRAVIEELQKLPGVAVHPSHGAFYLTVKLPIKDSEDFTTFMLNEFRYNGKTVAVAPLTGFFWEKGKGMDSIRLAYVLTESKLREAIRILGKGILAYNQKIK